MAKENKIKSCFMDEQPDFYYKVEVTGDNIQPITGTMRHLTDDDLAFIRREADYKVMTDDDGMPIFDKGGNIQHDFDLTKLCDAYIICVFGGIENNGNSRKIGQEGWDLDRECTFKNLRLLDRELKYRLYKEIKNQEAAFNENAEAIEKN